MISVPSAHVAGLPIEETLGSFGPALLVALGAASTRLRARLRRVHSRAIALAPPCKKGARNAAGRSEQETATRRHPDPTQPLARRATDPTSEITWRIQTGRDRSGTRDEQACTR